MPSTVVVGAQWGDEGKGKIVDLLAQQSDVVCRYQGGPNAGHTIVVDGETWKLRQMPSGVVSGTQSVIGASGFITMRKDQTVDQVIAEHQAKSYGVLAGMKLPTVRSMNPS